MLTIHWQINRKCLKATQEQEDGKKEKMRIMYIIGAHLVFAKYGVKRESL